MFIQAYGQPCMITKIICTIITDVDWFFLQYSLSPGGILLLLPTWPDTLPGWLGVCPHLLQVLKSSHDLPWSRSAHMTKSAPTLKVLGRGDPRDSVRQSAARRPATAEEAPKMYSGTAALKDPCPWKTQSRVESWRWGWPGQGGKLQSRELISRPPSQSWSRRQASSSCSQGEVKIWTRLSIWFVREKFNLMAVG